MLTHYLIKYYETEEHYESDAEEWINDKFYSEIAYTAKAQELMFNKFFYRIEIYKSDNKLNPIRMFLLSNFNRKKHYKENKRYE